MKKSGRFCFFLLILLLVVLPVLLWGELQATRWEAALTAQSDREAMLIAREIAVEIGLQVQDYVQLVEGLAKQVEVLGSLEPNVLQKMVTAQKEPFRHLSSVMFVGNAEGRSIAIDPLVNQFGVSTLGIEYHDRDYNQAVFRTDRTFIGSLRKGRALHDPAVQIAAPVHDAQGRLLTIAMGSIKMNSFQPQVDEILESLPGLKAVVMDRKGRVFVHPDQRALKEMLDLSEVPLFKPAVHPGGEVRAGIDETGVAVRAAVVPILERGVHWRVVVYRSEASIKAMCAAIRRRIRTAAVAGLLPGFILAGFLLRRN